MGGVQRPVEQLWSSSSRARRSTVTSRSVSASRSTFSNSIRPAKSYRGDPLKNSNYYAYGTPLLAVADGIVVETKDSIPENVPGANSRAVTIDMITVGGNHVALDIGGGKYALYAHVQPGSLKVKVGDRVKRGQVLALLGNSGNSTEPHVHFQIADGPTFLSSEGHSVRDVVRGRWRLWHQRGAAAGDRVQASRARVGEGRDSATE